MSSFKPLFIYGNGNYISASIQKAGSNNNSNTMNFTNTSNSTLSKFYICKNLTNSQNYAIWGGSTSTNTNCSNFVVGGNYTLFASNGDSWRSFYNNFGIPVPSNLDFTSLNLNNTLAFPLINTSGSDYNVDFLNPIIIPLSSNKLDADSWGAPTSTGNYFFSYDTSWFSSSSGSGDTPSGDSSIDLSGVVSAITLIPATILVICFFSVIYKMFMNRRVRP